MHTENLQMSKFRSTVFPIENRELKKFIPFTLIIFITVFNFTQLRNIKDTLLMTAPESGGAALSYAKTFIVMPTVILASALYVRMRKVCSFRKSYNIIVGVFLVFFAVFNYVVLPNADVFHMDPSRIAALKAAYPRIQNLFPVIGNWSFSLYYMMAELWGTFCLSVLFWQFANDNIGTHEAKRFYPPFLFFNALATYLVGVSMETVKSVAITNNIVIFSGLFMLAVFKYVNDSVLTDPQFTQDVSTKTKKPKVRLSFTESIKQLFSSPYIGYLSLLILCYGLTINMIEVCWKSEALKLYPLREDYMMMMARYSKITGLSGMVLVFISRAVLRRYGWTPCAIVTPLIIGITGAVYFSSVLFESSFSPMMLAAGFASPLSFIVSTGMVGVILSKSSKYSFFDPTKEMAYIPLDYDLRLTGKAAADGVGGRLGKAGSGWIQILLFFVTAASSLTEIMPYLAVFVLLLSVVWVVSVFRLSALYHQALADAETEA